jgi:cob(I)alamin adenosyltransferase
LRRQHAVHKEEKIEEMVRIFYGEGHGKSTAAMGRALQAASEGRQVFVIHYLKGRMEEEYQFMKRLEPEIKVFRFEKTDSCYENLTAEEKIEAGRNILNGVNFARKVLLTGECDLLILDEALGLVDAGLIAKEDLENLLRSRSDGMELILTGRTMDDSIRVYADEIYKIKSEK